MWLAVYLMDQDMEMFCDETVLRHASLEERKAYAKTLLSFVEKDGRVTMTAGMEQYWSPVGERIPE